MARLQEYPRFYVGQEPRRFHEYPVQAEAIDMKAPRTLHRARFLADWLIIHSGGIDMLEQRLYGTDQMREKAGPLTHLALKLARSKIAIGDITERTHVTYIVPMYNEINRMKPRGTRTELGEHPNGEDFIREKHKQLAWLHEANPNVTYDVRFVDDGCPDGSGAAAQSIISSEGYSNFSVQHLDHALETRAQQHDLVQTALQPLEDTSDSMKAGALFLGAATAIPLIEEQQHVQKHVIVFTDADLSVDLGQSGLVISPIANETAALAVGSRREETSFSDKSEDRNNRGKALIYLKELAVPEVLPLDTQCPLKAFDADFLRIVLEEGLDEYRFNYDLEIFAAAVKDQQRNVEAVAVAHFDSTEESTATVDAYIEINNAIVKLSRETEEQRDPHAPEFWIARRARLLLREISVSPAVYAQFLDRLPQEITGEDPHQDTFFDPVKLIELELIADSVLRESTNPN